ncbi:MAG TPA: CHAT domain-containing protein, partial [Bacteroidales bacterium]
MNSRNQILKFILFVSILTGSIQISVINGTERPVLSFVRNNHIISSINDSINKTSKEVEYLNESLKDILTSGDQTQGRKTVDNILQKISDNNIGDHILSESYYLIGIYFLKIKGYNEAIDYLDRCISIKEKNNEHDIRYARALYNLSVVYSNLEDLNKFENYASKSVEVGKAIYGESNPELVGLYSSLISACVEQKKYEKALNNSNIALTIANKNPGKVSPVIMADLYHNLGVCYDRLADFSKAKIYLDKTESIYKTSGLDQNDNFINLLNGLAVTYDALGFKEEASKYYEKGVALSISNNSSLGYNLINSYSIFLGNDNKEEKGEKLLKSALARAKVFYGLYPRDYFAVLNNYAAYLRDYRIDNRKSIECYLECIDYVHKNDHDQFLKTSVYTGYSRSLEEEGKPEMALEIIQSLLFPDRENATFNGNLDNPGVETLKPDLTSLKILKLKYNILWDIYKRKPGQRILEAASNTSELIVSLLDKVRINISEEESRLILGDKYRESYLNTIRDFNLLYIKTADPYFREKAFEYSEKSKVAALLTSTRELQATQFHIPSAIGDFERDLQREISLFNVRISEESTSETPNNVLIAKWKENLLEDIRKRDSLILVFEKQYPDYYAIKYNTQMVGLKDIPAIIGHNGNYINYVLSDTVLYTFVVNRKHQQLFATPVDTSFFNDIKRFRRLLSQPSPEDNASKKFNEFQSTGYRLYKILIDPVRSYLISAKVFISPDSYLSYLPFETIPTALIQKEGIVYRELNYMMNDFDISYTYSATFLAESEKKEYNRRNKLIAFAPNYPEPIDIQSVLLSRQAGVSVLNDLPYARQEAEYVS